MLTGLMISNSVLEPVKGLKSSISREFELSACGAAFSAVIGCDEAGRGPLCGPVVAAAAWVAPDVMIEHGINDSKATTEAQRVATYDMLVCHPAVKYAVVRIEHDEIDRINILQASLKAMRLACTSVLEQLQAADSSLDAGACLCLVDGNKVPSDMPVITRAIIKVQVGPCVRSGRALLSNHVLNYHVCYVITIMHNPASTVCYY